jgi:hypothetical protein
MVTQNGVHIARQLCPLAPPCSRRHVRRYFLSHDCGFFPTLHILAERISGTMQWTYRARHNSRLSRILSLRRAAQNSSVHCGIRPNRACAPFQRTRYSQTQTYGRTHTTYSGSANGQASVGPRCVLRLAQCEMTNGEVAFSLLLLVL